MAVERSDAGGASLQCVSVWRRPGWKRHGRKVAPPPILVCARVPWGVGTVNEWSFRVHPLCVRSQLSGWKFGALSRPSHPFFS